MKEERNYYPSITIDGNKWTSMDPLNCELAYNETLRMKDDYGAEKACVDVFTQGCLAIRDWKEGKCNRLRGSYLYSIPV